MCVLVRRFRPPALLRWARHPFRSPDCQRFTCRPCRGLKWWRWRRWRRRRHRRAQISCASMTTRRRRHGHRHHHHPSRCSALPPSQRSAQHRGVNRVEGMAGSHVFVFEVCQSLAALFVAAIVVVVIFAYAWAWAWAWAWACTCSSQRHHFGRSRR